MNAHKPHALILAGDEPTRRRLIRSLNAIGFIVRESRVNRAECEEHLHQPIDLCLIDGDADEGEVRWLVDVLTDRHPGCHVLLFAQTCREYIFNLVMGGQISHIMARRPNPSGGLPVVDEREVMVTCSKLMRPNIFGLDKYLPSWPLDTRQRIIASTADRCQAREDMAAYLDQLHCPNRLISLITMAADELLMNAMFSAPTDADGRYKYDDADRARPLALAAGEHVELVYTCDGYNILISVADNFGSLKRVTLVDHLGRGWLGQKREIRWDTGGAGLGLHMVFCSANQLVVNVNPGVRTELITIFYVREGLRRLNEMGHSLSLFFQ
ncbi:MAG: hypothetical protein MJE77_34860 [Proteobacteria bacterium]|nr:hypothetical protein [Pseudomonadota bacterium]